MRLDAKIKARQWILTAIQHHSCIPNKETEREIRKFVGRLQRDIKQLEKAKAKQDQITRHYKSEQKEREIMFERAMSK